MRTFLFVLALVWAQAAAAQTVEVQSGEHADFTRLALQIPQGAEWRLGRTETGYALQVEGARGFDLQDVYRLIPRDRLAEISAGETPGRLDLTVACACHALPFLWQSDWLVIDLRDGPATRGSPFEIAFDAGETQMDATDVTPEDDNATAQQVAPEPAESNVAQSPQVAMSDAQRAQIAALEAEVLSGIARAANQGLLTPVTPLAPETDTQTEALPPLDVPPPVAPPPDNVPGLRAESSVESARDAFRHLVLPSELDVRCRPYRSFDHSGWIDDRPPAEQIAALRNGLVSERESVDPEKVEALARAYIAFGFGREARQTLGLDGVASVARNTLLTMASLVDDDPVTDPAFADLVACAGAIGVWALLAHPAPSLDTVPDPTSIVQSFRQFPAPLQTLLGPRLSALLAGMGLPDLARFVLAPAQVAPDATPDVTMASAEIALAEGDTEAATEQLQTVAEAAPDTSPEAVITLVNLEIAAGEGVSQLSLDMIDGLLFQSRGTALAADLAILKIEALRANADFDAAFATLAAEAGVIDPMQQDALRDSLGFDLAAKAEDIAFLTIAFEDVLLSVTPATRGQIADRLDTLGFPGRAAEFRQTAPMPAPPAAAPATAPVAPLETAVEATAPAVPLAEQKTLISETEALRTRLQDLLSTPVN